MRNSLKYTVALFLLASAQFSVAFSQTRLLHKAARRDSIGQYMIIPSSLRNGQQMTAIGVYFTKIPYDWVENSIEVPLFSLANNFRFWKDFVLETSVQTVYISNQLRTGPHWYFSKDKFSLGAGLDAEFMFGKMNISGFNNTSRGWCLYPGISAGLRFREIAFSARAELTYISSFSLASGSEEIMHIRNRFSGGTLSFLVEQPLWKNRRMIVGVVNSYQKFFYPAWPSFSTFNRHYYIPQLYVGFVL
jgi:hypothetical protein